MSIVVSGEHFNPVYEYKPGPWQKALYLALLGMVVAFLLFAVAIINLTGIADRIEGSAECRFDENAEISSVNDLIDLWTARGLAASVRGQDEKVEEALRNIDTLSDEFEGAIAGREDIVEQCNGE